MPIISFINSEYKQFDGEKEYYNQIISVQHRNVANTGLKPPNDLQTNGNLLLSTCIFHCKFRFIFSLILSENAPNVHFRPRPHYAG